MNNKYNKRRKAFTLVELLVVIAIIAILAAVSVFTYTRFINKAKNVADQSVITELNHAYEAEKVLDDAKFKTPYDTYEFLGRHNATDLSVANEKNLIVYNQSTDEFEILTDYNDWSVNAEANYFAEIYQGYYVVSAYGNDLSKAVSAFNNIKYNDDLKGNSISLTDGKSYNTVHLAAKSAGEQINYLSKAYKKIKNDIIKDAFQVIMNKTAFIANNGNKIDGNVLFGLRVEEDKLRIDGKLILVSPIPRSLYQAVLARFKIMAEMNIAERRVPQDGKISFVIKDETYDFRVSTIPTINGEKIVIRIYNVSFTNDNLDALGFNDEQQELIYKMITRPHGIILLTGPTGSGKSTTMYTFLRYLNKDDTNIITVEDPVENQIKGINQVQVNAKANLTFAAALRSILRQDPNVIMIGEIRDEETAEIATRAAITGHLVLSTIHTNDVAGVVTRLINMGIPRYLVADSLLGAISQRLVRKLCPDCKEEVEVTDAEAHALGVKKHTKIYKPCGCKKCNHTGYSGRIGVFEIMILNDKIRELIMSPDFNTERLNELLASTMKPILENAKERVLAGITSFDEYEQLNDIVSVRK